MMEKCKCSECGFLALLNKFDQRLYETHALARKLGQFDYQRFDKFPGCTVNAQPIGTEMKDDSPQEFVRVVSDPRDCGRYFRWTPTFSPEKHVQMYYDQLLRESLERREKETTDRENKRDAAQLAWQENQHRANRRLQIALGVFAGVIGLACVLLSKYLPASPSQPPTIIIQMPADKGAPPK
jgi:hypothetical protein